MSDSRISWTGKTWNPVTGCDPGYGPASHYPTAADIAWLASLRLRRPPPGTRGGDVTPAGFHQAITFDPAAWREQAACRHMGAGFFFAERGQVLAEAKAVCAACPVRDDCLEYALANNERFGLWGGLSERERRRLRRGRGLPARERRAACPQGHELTDDNTYLTAGEYRRCQTCRRPARPAAPAKIDRRRLPDACPQGHPYPESLANRADQRVVCRICKRQRQAKRRAELKAELETVRARRRREAS